MIYYLRYRQYVCVRRMVCFKTKAPQMVALDYSEAPCLMQGISDLVELMMMMMLLMPMMMMMMMMMMLMVPMMMLLLLLLMMMMMSTNIWESQAAELVENVDVRIAVSDHVRLHQQLEHLQQ